MKLDNVNSQYILITHTEASVLESHHNLSDHCLYRNYLHASVAHSCLLKEVIIERLPPLRRKCPLMVLASGIKLTWDGRELLLCLLE